MIRLPVEVEMGVATHTGCVRSANEDDFLIYAPQTAEQRLDPGWFLAIADGMGGTMGGAEASRTAVRAAVRPHVRHAVTEPQERMRACFDEAVREVYTASRGNPGLRDMGTTLTIANYLGDRLIVGHVGDTRCLRLRDGALTQLTEDHAVTEPESFLTRCVGAGQVDVQVDIDEFEVRAGDRYVLATDGLWGVVPPAEIEDAIGNMAPQDAAEHLVEAANLRGGPDNSTLIILGILQASAGEPPSGEFREVDLPMEEPRQRLRLATGAPSLIAPRWPWVVLVLGAVLLVLGVLRLGFGMDPVGDLVTWIKELT